MKILTFDRCIGEVMKMPPSLTVIPDSALVQGSNPMFLADFSEEWVGEAYLAFRVSRLGKGIASKFASRYYDAVTVGLRAVAVNLSNELRLSQSAMGLTGAFDNALALGSWQPIADPAGDVPPNITLSVFGTGVSAGWDSIGINEAIVNLGRFMTVKTGDVVMPCRLNVAQPLRPNTIINAVLNGTEVLRLKIK